MTPETDDAVRGRHGRHRPPPRARTSPVDRLSPTLTPTAPVPDRPPLPGAALATFVVLAFAFSWVWWVPMAVRGQVARPGVGWPTHLPGLMGPALAAVVVTLGWQGTGALRDLGRRAVRWRGVGRWWWSVPGILALGAVGVTVSAVTGDPVDLGGLAEYSGAPVVSVLLLFGYVLVVNGYGEELGCAVCSPTAWSTGSARSARRCSSRSPGRPGTFRCSGWSTASARWGGPRSAGCWGCWPGRSCSPGSTSARGRSVLLVALWHTAFNFTSATTATQGLSAAITSTAVMAAAVVVLVRARRRDRAARAAHRPRGRGASEQRPDDTTDA